MRRPGAHIRHIGISACTDHLRVVDTVPPPQAGAGPGIFGWLWFGSTQPQGLEIRVEPQVAFAVLATRPPRRPPTRNYPVAEILFIRVTSKCLDSESYESRLAIYKPELEATAVILVLAPGFLCSWTDVSLAPPSRSITAATLF
jgi:hypothetical protein